MDGEEIGSGNSATVFRIDVRSELGIKNKLVLKLGREEETVKPDLDIYMRLLSPSMSPSARGALTYLPEVHPNIVHIWAMTTVNSYMGIIMDEGYDTLDNIIHRTRGRRNSDYESHDGKESTNEDDYGRRNSDYESYEGGEWSNEDYEDNEDEPFSIPQKLKVPLHIIKDVLFDILSGVEFLHARNIIHRDLKPANIMRFMPRLTTRIIDLGSCLELPEDAAWLKLRKSDIFEVVTTPSYTSPEVVFDQRFQSPALDSWSIGMIFLEMIVGKLPVDDDQATAVIITKMLKLMGQVRLFKDYMRPFVDAERQVNSRSPMAGHWRLLELESTVPMKFELNDFHTAIRSLIGCEGHNLLIRLLDARPTHRISVADAIRHPFFNSDLD